MPENGGPMGQVTSARYSQQLGRVIGMAWVPAALAKDGARDHDLRREQAARGRGPDEALLRPRRGDPALVSATAANPLAFLSPGPDAVAKSPMEPGTVAAGATIEQRDGWNVADGASPTRSARSRAVGFADVSHLGKLELQGDISAITGYELELGRALRADGAWWCPYSAERARSSCAHRRTPRRSATASSRPPRAPTASRA